MNQILSTSNSKSNGPLPIKVIVRFFAISLIVLGVIFFGESTYAFFSNNVSEERELDNTVPEITFAKDGNVATISVSHNKGINYVTYYWNDNAENSKTVKAYNYNHGLLINDISIPAGINTLYVEATDENGKTAYSSYEYEYEGIAIDIENVDYSYVKITASDVEGISYMTVKWNNDEETTVYPNEEGDIAILYESEIPLGENTLYVTAVNKENLTLQKKGNYKGLRKPEISMYIEDDYLYVNVTDENGIQYVTHQTNVGAEEKFETHGDKEFSYKYYIGGENILVTVTAVDIDGLSTVAKGKNY